MSDIYVVIRNQDNVAMTSVGGEPVIVLVRREELIYDEQAVSLRFADAFFNDFPVGRCTIVARHPLLNPVVAEQDIELLPNQILRVRFIYLELERQLLRIEVSQESLYS